jgi:hypothetical protein
MAPVGLRTFVLTISLDSPWIFTECQLHRLHDEWNVRICFACGEEERVDNIQLSDDELQFTEAALVDAKTIRLVTRTSTGITERKDVDFTRCIGREDYEF